MRQPKPSSILDLKEFLDEQVDRLNTKAFIENDPVSIPHQFSLKEDIEISGFLVATIAWGQRPVILKNSRRLMTMMDDRPFDFILHASKKDWQPFAGFVHRTFNGIDCIYFLKALQNLYQNGSSLEDLFATALKKSDADMGKAISNSRTAFFSFKAPERTGKHFASPDKNASAKRINMFLRWMVRKDKQGVDFGIWKSVKPSQLFCPLDVHSGRVARELGLLTRKQDDWKAVAELTENLRKLDKHDPIKYDFALFGLGVEE